MRRTQRRLRWLERVLLAVGLALGGWSLYSAAETHYYRSMPVPEPSAASTARTLPGEGPSNTTASPASVRGSAVEPGAWVARLEAPTAGLTATVIEGSSETQLAKAAGHIEGTAFPGEPTGNVGIAGHRDTIFRPVRKLREGDPLRLTTQQEVLEYRVTRTFIVSPDAVHVLDATAAPTLTMVTCYPFTFIGHAPQRYIVQAELVSSRARQGG